MAKGKTSPSQSAGADTTQSASASAASPSTQPGTVTSANRQRAVPEYEPLLGVPFHILLALLAPLALHLSMTTLQLTPLYNTRPLTLHRTHLYGTYGMVSAALFFLGVRPSARTGVMLVGIGVVMAAAGGRYVGAYVPEVFKALGVDVGGVGGAVISQGIVGWVVVPACLVAMGQSGTLMAIYQRWALVTVPLYLVEGWWSTYFSGAGAMSILAVKPECTMIILSCLIMALTALLPTPAPTQPGAGGNGPRRRLAQILVSTLPLSYLLLTNLALLDQNYFQPRDLPFSAADGELIVRNSTKSISGQIVVADHNNTGSSSGFRILRADHSLLGGVWTRRGEERAGGQLDLGDSIFMAFPLQEVVTLVERPVQLAKDSALILGLGVGISARRLSQRGLDVDVVEYDQAVYDAADRYFGLDKYPLRSVTIDDGGRVIRAAAQQVEDGLAGPKWSYVIHDVFTTGSLPVQLFSRGFWLDVRKVLRPDGVLAVNFVGTVDSKATKVVAATLLSVFQCRLFGDSKVPQAGDKAANLLFICAAKPPTFRAPTEADALRSPLRRKLFSTFQENEVDLAALLPGTDPENDALILDRDTAQSLQKDMVGWLAELAADTWTAMEKILTPEMWMAW